MKNYDNVVIFDHPLIRHKIAILRDERTSMKEFRELVEEITTLMTYESLKDGVETTAKEVGPHSFFPVARVITGKKILS